MLSIIFRKKIYAGLTMLLTVIALGVLGYRFISDYTWLEAFYMTIITLSTVGFGEVRPSDDFTKLFTIFLIMSSVVIFTYAISILSQYFSSFRIDYLRLKRMKKKIQSLSNHIIVCGYGKNGKQAVNKFLYWKKDFVVIEKNASNITDENILHMEGDAINEDILIQAGIKRAKHLIIALPNDADNLFIVLSARQLNKELFIISRISKESVRSKLKLAGADYTVMPDKIGGDYMASLLTHPDLTKFLEHITSTSQGHINIEELSVDELSEEFENKTLVELNLRQKTGCNVIGYKPIKGHYIINPESHIRLEKHSKLFVLGQEKQIEKLNKLLNIKPLNA